MRRRWQQGFAECSATELYSVPPDVLSCAYVVCGRDEVLCGTSCYNNESQVCCDGAVFDVDATKTCCGSNYFVLEAGFTCCGGMRVRQIGGHQCCGTQYTTISPSEICCDGVIGAGNACCDSIPYTSSSASPRVCCGGRVFPASAQRQCCGDRMVPSSVACCADLDDSSSALAYTAVAGKVCCGTDYVHDNITKCCAGTPHAFLSPSLLSSDSQVCCDTNLIDSSLGCCNGVGYDASTEVCADRPTASLPALATACGQGTVCASAADSTAFCDMCGFDVADASCHYVSRDAIALETFAHPLHTADDYGVVHDEASATHAACALVVCDGSDSICNGTCFDDTQVCCNGVLFDHGMPPIPTSGCVFFCCNQECI